MNFSSIFGHTHIKNRLVEGVKAGRIPHAQLFGGGVECRTLPMAVAYARYILCENRATSDDACGVCPTCHRTSTFEHPDLHFIFPVNKSKSAKSTGRSDEKPLADHFLHIWREFYAEKQGIFTENEWYEAIGIENQQGNINKEEANELLRKMSFKSFEGGYKVVVIYLPERMNDQAANTLLKLVEEPPPMTLFLFASETPDRIITTIRSRVQSIALPPIDTVGLKGGVGRRGEEFFALFSSLMRLGYGAKYLDLFDWAEEISGIGREGQRLWVDYSVAFLRECYIIGVGVRSLSSLEGGQRDFAEKFAPFVNQQTIEPLVGEFELAARQIKQNGAPRIVFTHFAMMISKILVNAKRSIAAGK